jgi:hypothetical protein
MFIDNKDLFKKAGKSGNDINVADMNLTFDDNGKVIKLEQVNPDTLVDISEMKNIIKSGINESLTEVRPPEYMEIINKMRV